MSEHKRTPMQALYSTAWHEAGHAVAGWQFGHEITGIELGDSDQLIEGEVAGCVRFKGSTSIYNVQEDIITLLAGSATCMTAFASGLIPPESIGVEEPDDEEMMTDEDVEVLLATPPDANPASRAAFAGWHTHRDNPDELQARKLAEAFSATPDEAGPMIAWLRQRTLGIVGNEKFMHLAGRLAGALLEFRSMSGEHVAELLRRWSAIYKPTEEEATP